VIALSIAAALVIFLVYTSLAGGTPSIKPSQLAGHHSTVQLVGAVVGPVRGDAHATPMRFRLRDIGGKASVPVVYRGSVPDLFRVGRHISITGKTNRQGTFVAEPGSLITKCPSKYSPRS
jgi:cytochrome c-type biogenesis protein CcmE